MIKPNQEGANHTMGWMITPVRDTPDEPLADDYVLWSSIVDAPIFRGTRDEVTKYWRREYGNSGVLGIGKLFERADATGSSASLSGKWGDHILCMEVPGDSGLLPRDRMREFADLMFPDYPNDCVDEAAVEANAEKISVLLEPIDWGED